jgi:hypothetical protein
MSIFGNDNIQATNDDTIEQLYNLEWDYVKGKRIRKGLFPKNLDGKFSYPHGSVYYNPMYVFFYYVGRTLDSIRDIVSKKDRGKIELSKLDEGNLMVRFNRMITECGVLQYKGDTYIKTDLYDANPSSLKNRIIETMFNYISKETCNSKYFKRTHKK